MVVFFSLLEFTYLSFIYDTSIEEIQVPFVIYSFQISLEITIEIVSKLVLESDEDSSKWVNLKCFTLHLVMHSDSNERFNVN